MFTLLKACLITSSKERETEAVLNLYLQEVPPYLRVPGVRYRSPSGSPRTRTIASLIILPHVPHLPPSQPGKHSAHSGLLKELLCDFLCKPTGFGAQRLSVETGSSFAPVGQSVSASWVIARAPPSIQMNPGRFLIAGLL